MYFSILSGFNLLAVNPGLVFWTVVTFLIVLFCLWLFAWNPLLEALDKRNDKIEDDLRKSVKLKEEAEALVREYQKKIELALQESAKILTESRQHAEINQQKIIKKAEAEAEEVKNRALKDIEQSKTLALNEIQSQVSEITIMLLSKIMNETIDEAKHKQLISNALKSIKI